MRAAARTYGTRRKQVTPLRMEQISRAIMNLSHKPTLKGLRDTAMVLLAYDGLLRRSELAGVRVEHLEREKDGTGRLMLPISKTDPEARGVLIFVTADTMRALDRWMDAAGITEGPVFLSFRGRSAQPSATGIRADKVPLVFKFIAKQAGMDAKGVSGHSLRVGAAIDMFLS